MLFFVSDLLQNSLLVHIAAGMTFDLPLPVRNFFGWLSKSAKSKYIRKSLLKIYLSLSEIIALISGLSVIALFVHERIPHIKDRNYCVSSGEVSVAKFCKYSEPCYTWKST